MDTLYDLFNIYIYINLECININNRYIYIYINSREGFSRFRSKRARTTFTLTTLSRLPASRSPWLFSLPLYVLTSFKVPSGKFSVLRCQEIHFNEVYRRRYSMQTRVGGKKSRCQDGFKTDAINRSKDRSI